MGLIFSRPAAGLSVLEILVSAWGKIPFPIGVYKSTYELHLIHKYEYY